MQGRRGGIVGIASLLVLALAGSLVAAWALVDPGGSRGDGAPPAGANSTVSPAPTTGPSPGRPGGAGGAPPPQTPTTTPAATAPTRAAGPEPPRGPVVVIPGYGGQTALLRPLVEALRRDGREVHLVAGMGSPTSNLNTQARILGREVDRLVEEGAPSVDVIGFSAGGLVTRIWAEDGGSALTRRVVTLGAPHHGSEVAELAQWFVPKECPVVCRQLTPGSALLQRLDDTAPGPRWVSVWTRDDRISTPPRTAVLDGALSIAVQEVCPGARVEHGMLPRTGFVVDLVVTALDAPDPLVSAPPPAASGCPAPA